MFASIKIELYYNFIKKVTRSDIFFGRCEVYILSEKEANFKLKEL